MISIFRKIRVKWQIWRGQAIDIWSKNAYPADVLSNLCSNGFRFDGVVCGSMEGFLQSLKLQDINKQRQICSMKGKNAKKQTSAGWQTDQLYPIPKHTVNTKKALRPIPGANAKGFFA